MFLFLAALNGGAQAAERTIVIENPTDRGVYMAYSVESADEIISEGYWYALPKDENTLTVTGDGQISLRLNFDEDTSKPLNLPGTERCGSLTEKFKSIENKTGSPKVILYSGDGDLDGYATKRKGRTVQKLVASYSPDFTKPFVAVLVFREKCVFLLAS